MQLRVIHLHQLLVPVVAFEAIVLSLNKLNTAEAAFVMVKVIVVPDPASSDTRILLIIALELAGVV
jgi:hypothetical protein